MKQKLQIILGIFFTLFVGCMSAPQPIVIKVPDSYNHSRNEWRPENKNGDQWYAEKSEPNIFEYTFWKECSYIPSAKKGEQSLGELLFDFEHQFNVTKYFCEKCAIDFHGWFISAYSSIEQCLSENAEAYKRYDKDIKVVAGLENTENTVGYNCMKEAFNACVPPMGWCYWDLYQIDFHECVELQNN